MILVEHCFDQVICLTETGIFSKPVTSQLDYVFDGKWYFLNLLLFN